MDFNSSSDSELLRLMLAGDENAFITLYRRRQAGIYRFALQMSGSEAIAEDVTQEVFMTLIREGKQYKPELGSVSSFLYGIARNFVMRYLTRTKPHISIEDELEKIEEASIYSLVAKNDPLENLIRSDEIQIVRQAILALPEHYREVVILCELHEMNYNEAANILRCAVGTVRSRLHRARALLIERLCVNGRESLPTDGKQARCLL
jgi:RNA polymerase sigma-70 factor, ECF subfamily